MKLDWRKDVRNLRGDSWGGLRYQAARHLQGGCRRCGGKPGVSYLIHARSISQHGPPELRVTSLQCTAALGDVSRDRGARNFLLDYFAGALIVALEVR